MRLCFLTERRYAPYPKWFGTAFAELVSAAQIGPLLSAALRADERKAREAAIAQACQRVAELHVRLENPGALRPKIMTFTEMNRTPGVSKPASGIAPERDYMVVNASELAECIRGQISDPEIAGLAPVGGVDQFSNSTDLLERPQLSHAVVRAVCVAQELSTGIV